MSNNSELNHPANGMRRLVHPSLSMQFGGAVLDLAIVVNSLDLLLTPLWLRLMQLGGAVLDLVIESQSPAVPRHCISGLLAIFPHLPA